MVINKGRIYTFTVVAVIMYVFLQFLVKDKPFGGVFFGDNFAKTLDGTWIVWLCLILIPVFGFILANEVGDREIDITPRPQTGTPGEVQDPAFWKVLTSNRYLSILWLPLRFVLGIGWLQAGYHKIFDAGWGASGTTIRNGQEMVMERGDSMKFFIAGALGRNPMTGEKLTADDGTEVAARTVFGWYENFLNWILQGGHTSWFGPLIAWGETLVGLGLLFGALIGIAAFFGTLMNMSFMLAGTVSANPWMFALTIFIILGWKVAGYLGLDRWLLPMLGTPWSRDEASPPPAA